MKWFAALLLPLALLALAVACEEEEEQAAPPAIDVQQQREELWRWDCVKLYLAEGDCITTPIESMSTFSRQFCRLVLEVVGEKCP
jgi:hypothetical protein